ncbi:hypothetical protein Avbf_07027 [Armadillidium vulgare]|nr:hypothetical protein Avbf_07027 [Armadillidium vulgare]
MTENIDGLLNVKGDVIKVTLVEESEYGNELTFWDAYKATINSPMMYNSIGEIRETNNDVKKHGLENLDLEPWSRRNNLNGLEIICSVLDTYPENSLIENGDGMVKDVGNLGQLYQIIVNSLNATTRCSRPPDNQWGFLTSNDSWVGMIGELVRGKRHNCVSADFT